MSESKVLFWHDEGTVGYVYTWMDRFINYFGLEPRVIDTLSHFKRGPNRYPVPYQDLQSALEDMSDHNLVFIDPKGEHLLDEFQHPKGPTVYAFGSNLDGFEQDISGLGQTVRLRNPDEVYVLHALPIVLYDRELCLAGRR